MGGRCYTAGFFPPAKRGRRGGWTLVEILVVVGIVVVLLAVLVPVLGRARDRARDGACTSNLRQLALASQYYAENWSGVLPHKGDGTYPPAEGSFYWLSTEDTNAKIQEVLGLPPGVGPWACPTARARISLPAMVWDCDYTVNPYLGGSALGYAYGSAPRMERATAETYWWADGPVWSDMSSLSMIVADLYPENCLTDPYTWNVPWPWELQPQFSPYTANLGHGGGPAANFVFGDAHVEPITIDQFRARYPTFEAARVFVNPTTW